MRCSCSSLSHFAVLQSLRCIKVREGSCSSLSHFAVLQCRGICDSGKHSCSSLSHFAVLQSNRNNGYIMCCCSSLSHFAVLQSVLACKHALISCSSLSHFAVLQYFNGKSLFHKGFPFYLFWKNGLKITIIGLNWPFFLGFSARPTAVSWRHIAFLLSPNSGLSLLAEGLHTVCCGVFATNRGLWRYGCIRKVAAFGIRLLIKTGGIDWRLCALPPW